MNEANQSFFNRQRTVSEYDEYYVSLIPPENLILERIQDQNRSERPVETLLDIGIGAGRTTRFFAPHAKKYIGIDYAANMVEHCRKQFTEQLSHAEFRQSDARNLSFVPDQSVDWAMFSFNGIDCISAEERTQVFKSVKRVLKPDGCFSFSSHNLLSLPSLYRVHFTLKPIGIYWEIMRNLKIRKLNPPLESLLERKSASVRDGVHQFQIAVVYIHPEEEIRLLRSCGFSNIQVLLPDSKEPISPENLDLKAVSRFSSVNYVCQTR